MADPKFDYSELTKEKRLWDVYKSSLAIPSSKFNTVSTFIVATLLVANIILGDQSIDDLVLQVRSLADTGLPLSLSTLGLLLAGFTVFATISDPKLTISMSEIVNQASGLSFLKHNYFIFLRVFIYYLTFSVFCLLIIMFGQKGGLISTIISMTTSKEIIRDLVAKIVYVVLLTGYYFLIMQLKSFIFNIYISVMSALRWEAEQNN